MAVKRILFATDFSDASDRAAAFVRRLAEDLGAAVTVMTALEPLPGYYAPHLEGGPPGVMENIEKGLKKELAEYAGKNFAGLSKVESRVTIGKAAEAIIKAATAAKADMIVMGTQGRSGLSRLLLGSTAEKVLRTSQIPVMTVPAKT